MLHVLLEGYNICKYMFISIGGHLVSICVPWLCKKGMQCQAPRLSWGPARTNPHIYNLSTRESLLHFDCHLLLTVLYLGDINHTVAKPRVGVKNPDHMKDDPPMVYAYPPPPAEYHRWPASKYMRLSAIYIAMWLVPGELWYLVGVGIYHRWAVPIENHRGLIPQGKLDLIPNQNESS